MCNNLYTLITGASEGFGKALAIECASRKMNLILVALPKSKLNSFAESLKQKYEIEVLAIEKDLSINEEIERLRLSTTTALLSGRRDIIVVSSVSCIYGMGNPDDFYASVVRVKVGDVISRKLEEVHLEKYKNF